MRDFPGAPEILPIHIREDVTVRIHGIPFDLTLAEAAKVGRVVMALALPADGDLSRHEQAGTATDCGPNPSPNATPGSEET